MDKAYTHLTYVASGAAVVLGFMNENAASLGILIALFTFLVNVYFRHKQLEVLKNRRSTDIKDLE